MGFYPTYKAIFNAYTRSKLAYIRGLQGPIYARAKAHIRDYVIVYARFKNSSVYAGMKSAFLRKGRHV